ncbi:CapA family protein [Pirellulaceae bacterium SH449]
MTVRLLFLGDYAPCRRFESIALERSKNIFGNLSEVINDSDFSFVNLETPLTDCKTPIAKSGPALKSSPGCAEPLAAAGIDLVGLANNHIMDFGDKGLKDTLKTCADNGLATTGAGLTLNDARKPHIVCVHGLRLGILAIAEREFNCASINHAGAADFDLIDNLSDLKMLKGNVDFVVVTFHGGNEYFPLPRPGLRRLARFLLENGADAIIGHHPHVPSAYEIINGKPVVYSLGNLIFDHDRPPKDWNLGYGAILHVDKDCKRSSLEIIPYEQSITLAGVQLLQDSRKSEFDQKIKELNSILSHTEAYQLEWKRFCQERFDSVFYSNYSSLRLKGIFRILKSINAVGLLLGNSDSVAKKLNMVRCPSHRELLEELLSTRLEKKTAKISFNECNGL